jgi:hypothetical protein
LGNQWQPLKTIAAILDLPVEGLDKEGGEEAGHEHHKRDYCNIVRFQVQRFLIRERTKTTLAQCRCRTGSCAFFKMAPASMTQKQSFCTAMYGIIIINIKIFLISGQRRFSSEKKNSVPAVYCRK